jgi:hypothetical protein
MIDGLAVSYEVIGDAKVNPKYLGRLDIDEFKYRSIVSANLKLVNEEVRGRRERLRKLLWEGCPDLPIGLYLTTKYRECVSGFFQAEQYLPTCIFKLLLPLLCVLGLLAFIVYLLVCIVGVVPDIMKQ